MTRLTTATELEIRQAAVDPGKIFIDRWSNEIAKQFEKTLLGQLEPPPMFTKQHYEQVAGMLNAQRRRIRSNGLITDSDRQIELRALNDVVMGFVSVFKKDQPKFRELQFIGACDNDAPTDTAS